MVLSGGVLGLQTFVSGGILVSGGHWCLGALVSGFTVSGRHLSLGDTSIWGDTCIWEHLCLGDTGIWGDICVWGLWCLGTLVSGSICVWGDT